MDDSDYCRISDHYGGRRGYFQSGSLYAGSSGGSREGGTGKAVLFLRWERYCGDGTAGPVIFMA